MLKNIVVIIVLCLFAMACDGSDKIKKPDNLIAKEKMSDILYDLYIINAAKGINKKLLETNGFRPETYLLTKYNIDSTQFADSNTYYALNTEVYRVIVDTLKARLQKEKVTFEELKIKEGMAAKGKRDSIKDLPKNKKSTFKKVIVKKDSVIK